MRSQPILFTLIFACYSVLGPIEARAQDGHPNIATNSRGELPIGNNGKRLNTDFETGDLTDWTATGEAFQQQPIRGEIDANRPFAQGKRSDKTGDYWIGGYEKLRDRPRGTLTSASFQVNKPFASFLIGGGSHSETRVELIRTDTQEPIFVISGTDDEAMRPVVVDLQSWLGKKLAIRVVDDFVGGWGHVNFDDFRLHDVRPQFTRSELARKDVPTIESLYPNAGLDATTAAKMMVVPKGFTVQAAAFEPEVQQPIAIALDDRGRVWIAEAYEYPRRAPEGQGRDRILIFEDTDLDGKLDKRTVFAEKLNLVSGLEVGFGGVWVGAAPYLLFIPDRDGDDKPDSEPQILLDGWGYHDTHETLNAFIWGPDGWLYGCHGVFTHSKVGKPGSADRDRIPLNAGIWRYHPTRHQFDVFAEGTSNPWGVDFNDHGQAFCTACVIPHLFHVIQGARYERQGGQHFNPHTYTDIKTIADHLHYTGNQWNNNDRRSSDELGGGHAHAGAMIYLGGAWPSEFRDQLFMHNIHGNRVNVDLLRPRGSGYVGGHGNDFLLTRDQWSQMLNLRYGPDGQVWLIDWYDKNQCHRNEPDTHDRSNGRIYRVVYQDARPKSVNLRSATDEQLIRWQLDPNEWYVRHARRVLQERAHAGTLAAGTLDQLRKLALESDQDTRRLRGLLAFHATGGDVQALAGRLLRDPSPYLRAWTIQLACEKPNAISAELLQQFVNLAANDSSPIVRLYLASAMPRLPVEGRWGVLEKLVQHDEDASDHNLPLMYWYALEPLCDVDNRRALALGLMAGSHFPSIRDFTIRRVGAAADNALQLLTESLRAAKTDELRLAFLRGMNEALRGRRKVESSPEQLAGITPLTKSSHSEIQVRALALTLTLGDSAAAEQLRGFLSDETRELAQRRLALLSLQQHRDAGLPKLLHRLVQHSELAGDAIRSLALFDSAETPRVLIGVYTDRSLAERRDILSTLSSRTSFAHALLNAVEQNQIPAQHLTPELVRQLRNLKDKDLDAKVAAVWGIVRDTPADRAAEIIRVRRMLNVSSPPPDLELGRALFAKSCQQCHTLFAVGGKIGPDLTGSNRMNNDYLLSNIIDPSAVMAKEYQPALIETVDGRLITGIVKQSDATTLTLQTTNETLVVPRSDIELQRQSDKSMMPDNLLQGLDEFQIRSLVAYLQSARQTSILATTENVGGFYNGKDLSGWRGNPDLWKVENGEIVGTSPGLKNNEFLISELSASDFVLTLEVKLTPNAENSGIQFRSEALSDGGVRGYQADVGAGWWGKLYEEHGRALLWKESGEKHVKVEDWNRYVIRAQGDQIQTWINGEKCVAMDDPPGARRGVFALQIHSGGAMQVRFRNLKLEPIK